MLVGLPLGMRIPSPMMGNDAILASNSSVRLLTQYRVAFPIATQLRGLTQRGWLNVQSTLKVAAMFCESLAGDLPTLGGGFPHF